ncbi:MAG: hypothetical protein QXM96_00955 [Candidatus Woesearchaeota archaeon]
MATTIQINETTLQILKDIKEKENYKTYDEVILNILKDKMKNKIIEKETMFGILRENPIKYNKKEHRMKFKSED